MINTTRFDIKEESKADDGVKPRFKSTLYTSNERLYAEGIALLFIRYDPYEIAQKTKEY